MQKYRVINDGDFLHAGEVGEKYAEDDKRIYLVFHSGNKMGYLKQELEPLEASNCACTKPPLGLMPKHIWDAKRKQDIEEAIARYMDKNKPVPIEWIEEYNFLISPKQGR